jgi:hypothetical protein
MKDKVDTTKGNTMYQPETLETLKTACVAYTAALEAFTAQWTTKKAGANNNDAVFATARQRDTTKRIRDEIASELSRREAHALNDAIAAREAADEAAAEAFTKFERAKVIEAGEWAKVEAIAADLIASCN